MSRRTKLTPDRSDVIVEAITKGATREVAALASGVSERVLYIWLARGESELEVELDPDDHRLAELRDIARTRQIPLHGARKKTAIAEQINAAGGTIYVQFFQDVKRAEAVAELHAIDMLFEVGSDDWRMWMTYLERTRARRWARKTIPIDEAEDVDTFGGDEREAQEMLDRSEEVRVKMLETGT